ncbi:MAG: Do family serine endopeptidase [Proteobacteria bacterium]|nr:Do family serine endopeptidase [Pseudomonadota bacterium]
MKKVLPLAYFFVAVFALQNQALAQKKNTIPTKEITASPKQLASEGFADIVEDLLPAVVNISAMQDLGSNNSNAIDSNLLADLPKSPLFEEFKNQLEEQFRNQPNLKRKVSSIGSGFIISKDGYIVTNSHVIEDSDEIKVSLNDSSKYKAKVIGIDKRTDLALIKINAEKELKFVKFGDSNKARIGDWVIVIGNPYGLGGSVSVGIVSARSRDINNGQSDEFIQTDAAINKGNSGGPLFNMRGEVIGVSTAIFSPSGGNVGIGFATPSTNAAQVIKQLREQGEVTRGWLGVSVQDITDEIAESIKMEKAKGAFVNDVTKNGPADKAGILPTDIIIKFDNQDISEMKILPKAVAQTAVGRVVNVTLIRRGKIKNLKVKIEKMQDEEVKKSENKPINKKLSKPLAQILKLGVVELGTKIKKERNIESNIEGLLVVEVDAKSEAAEKGVMSGDIILSVNQSPIKTISDLQKIIEDSKKSTKKLFLFLKRGNTNYAIVLSTN